MYNRVLRPLNTSLHVLLIMFISYVKKTTTKTTMNENKDVVIDRKIWRLAAGGQSSDKYTCINALYVGILYQTRYIRLNNIRVVKK